MDILRHGGQAPGGKPGLHGLGLVENTTYSEASTGRARLIPRCACCLGGTHASNECAYAPASADIPLVPAQGGGQARVTARPSQIAPPKPTATSETCRLFNSGMCRYLRCRYAQVCMRCRLSHPTLECSDRHRHATGLPSSLSLPADGGPGPSHVLAAYVRFG